MLMFIVLLSCTKKKPRHNWGSPLLKTNNRSDLFVGEASFKHAWPIIGSNPQHLIKKLVFVTAAQAFCLRTKFFK